jgi:hypothetical protein
VDPWLGQFCLPTFRTLSHLLFDCHSSTPDDHVLYLFLPKQKYEELSSIPPTATPVYESSEGGEESVYDDRMSLEHWCAKCRATYMYGEPETQSCEAAAAACSCVALVAPH